jgi:hypothetical protein
MELKVELRLSAHGRKRTDQCADRAVMQNITEAEFPRCAPKWNLGARKYGCVTTGPIVINPNPNNPEQILTQ